MRDIDAILEQEMEEDEELDIYLDDVDDELIDDVLMDDIDESGSVIPKPNLFNDPIYV